MSHPKEIIYFPVPGLWGPAWVQSKLREITEIYVTLTSPSYTAATLWLGNAGLFACRRSASEHLFCHHCWKDENRKYGYIICMPRTIWIYKFRCRDVQSIFSLYFISERKKTRQQHCLYYLATCIQPATGTEWAVQDLALKAGAHLHDNVLTSRQTRACSAEAKWGVKTG